jgi:hypothetical protein
MDVDTGPAPYFYAWVTTATDDYAEALCAKLVRRGFYVGPMARHLITSFPDNPAHVVAIVVYRAPRNDDEKKEYTVTGIHAEIVDVIKQLKGKFWSLIVSKAAGCTWNIGNCKLSDEQKVTDMAKKLN